MSNVGPPPPDGDHNKAAAIMIPQSIIGAIAFILFCTRVYVRAKIVRKLWWDDLLVSFGMVRRHWNFSEMLIILVLMRNTAIFPHPTGHQWPRNTLWRWETPILFATRPVIPSSQVGDCISVSAGRLYHVYSNFNLPVLTICVRCQRQVEANLLIYYWVYYCDQRPCLYCNLSCMQTNTEAVESPHPGYMLVPSNSRCNWCLSQWW